MHPTRRETASTIFFEGHDPSACSLPTETTAKRKGPSRTDSSCRRTHVSEEPNSPTVKLSRPATGSGRGLLSLISSFLTVSKARTLWAVSEKIAALSVTNWERWRSETSRCMACFRVTQAAYFAWPSAPPRKLVAFPEGQLVEIRSVCFWAEAGFSGLLARRLDYLTVLRERTKNEAYVMRIVLRPELWRTSLVK